MNASKGTTWETDSKLEDKECNEKEQEQIK
jgi:hypothetical protein